MKNMTLIALISLTPLFAQAEPKVKVVEKSKHSEVRHTDKTTTVVKTDRDGTTSRNEGRDTTVHEGKGYSHETVVRDVKTQD